MKKTLLNIIFILSLISSLFYFVKLSNKQNISTSEPLIIVLSPHFDDGVLSLGGYVAKHEKELLVATFFTQKPAYIVHTEWDKISGFSNSDEAFIARRNENQNALNPFNAKIKNYDYPDFQYRTENKDQEIRENISKDIETLMATYQNRELFIYGPATFGSKITHPDHQIVHDALMNVWKKNKKPNVHFLIYEDFPYILRFNKSNLGDLNIYLEKTENIKFREEPIELSREQLSEKVSNISLYKSQIRAFMSSGEDIKVLAQKFYKERCKKTLPEAYACEIVYTAP